MEVYTIGFTNKTAANFFGALIEKGVGMILSVGLARAFRVQGDTARRHWLQVSNFHLEVDPTWQVEISKM